jgi:hypothetical protein
LISGHFGLNFVLPLPVVRVSLHLPRITKDFVAIDFLLDTGATNTCLHPQDAMTKVGIPMGTLSRPDRWHQRMRMPGIGGSPEYYIWPAIYGFDHDDGHFQQLSGEIRIAPLPATNPSLPSLLGWDVLRYFRVDVDFAGQQVVLR